MEVQLEAHALTAAEDNAMVSQLSMETCEEQRRRGDSLWTRVTEAESRQNDDRALTKQGSDQPSFSSSFLFSFLRNNITLLSGD